EIEQRVRAAGVLRDSLQNLVDVRVDGRHASLRRFAAPGVRLNQYHGRVAAEFTPRFQGDLLPKYFNEGGASRKQQPLRCIERALPAPGRPGDQGEQPGSRAADHEPRLRDSMQSGESSRAIDHALEDIEAYKGEHGKKRQVDVT